MNVEKHESQALLPATTAMETTQTAPPVDCPNGRKNVNQHILKFLIEARLFKMIADYQYSVHSYNMYFTHFISFFNQSEEIHF